MNANRKPLCRKLWMERLVFIYKHRKLIRSNIPLAAREMQSMGLFARSRASQEVEQTLREWLNAI